MAKTYGVTQAAKLLSGAQSRFDGLSRSKVGESALSTARGRENRLRGEMEHMSYEAAVDRYMNPGALSRKLRVDLIFGVVVVVGFALIGAIALMFHFHF